MSAPVTPNGPPRPPHPAAVEASVYESQQAILNILEDFHADRNWAAEINGAILDDFDADKRFQVDTNRAVINILDDLEEAKARTELLNSQLEQRVLERTAELTRSEERFRLLVEGVRDYAIFMLDPDGHVATWNTGAERTKGYTAEEILGRHFSVFYTPEAVARGKPEFELGTALGSERFEEEGERVRKDGSRFWANVTLTALHDAGGRHVGFVKITRDITERKRAMETMRLMVEGSPIGMVMVKADGTISLVNRQMETMFGYDRSEIEGQPVERLLPLPIREKHVEYRTRFMAAPQVRSMGTGRDLRAVRKDGSAFPVEVSLSPIQSDGSLYVLASIVDITERLVAESKSREALRQEVLLKEIHHRVKNNLQVISSLLFLQSAHVTDRATLGILTESQSRVKSIALIHEKLYRSHDLEKLAFGEYVQDLIAELMRTYGPSRSNVALRTDVRAVSLGIDTAVPCGLILNELVSNAYKHAFPAGAGGEIRVTLAATGADRFELTVRDTGAGIPADVDWRKCKSLGLKLVSDLTKQINGELAVRSAVGEGTAFTVAFAEVKYKDRG